MITEQSLATFNVDELVLLLRDKLEKLEQLELGNEDLKTRELARIELDLIEYVIDKRTANQKH